MGKENGTAIIEKCIMIPEFKIIQQFHSRNVSKKNEDIGIHSMNARHIKLIGHNSLIQVLILKGYITTVIVIFTFII